MLKLTENQLLDIATKDIEGYDLYKYITKLKPELHPSKAVAFLNDLFQDKEYQKLVASMITIKLQRIRSQVLKQIDELMCNDSDMDVLKSLDKLLAIVLRFTKLDDEEEKTDKIIIRYTDGTEEKFHNRKTEVQE